MLGVVGGAATVGSAIEVGVAAGADGTAVVAESEITVPQPVQYTRLPMVTLEFLPQLGHFTGIFGTAYGLTIGQGRGFG